MIDAAGVAKLNVRTVVPEIEMRNWDRERIDRFFYGIAVAESAASGQQPDWFENLLLQWSRSVRQSPHLDRVTVLRAFICGLETLLQLEEARESKQQGLSEGAGI